MFPELQTPAVLVDVDIAQANIDRFQSYCDGHGLPTRPHIKTHKLPCFAKAQLAAGSIGITCQKITEAKAMISEGGISDVLLTYNIVGAAKIQALRALAGQVTLSVVADNATVIKGLAAGFDASAPLRVLVECDTGAQRCGVQSQEEALALARIIDAADGLRFGGLMTYPPAGDQSKVNEWLSTAISLIESQGFAIETVSVGGTPNMWRAHEVPVATEWRAGTYIYNDRSMVDRGICEISDCALTVMATIVSRPTEKRAIIDAGSKVLTSDLLGLDGHGHVIGHPDIRIDQLSEEHGRMTSEAPIPFAVGDRVRIIPNHACVVTNMVNTLSLVAGDDFVETKVVPARGCVE